MPKAEPPSDPLAERRLLGALLLRPSSVVNILGRLDAHDFFLPQHGALFGELCALAVEGKPISPATVGAGDTDTQKLVASCLEGALPDEADFWARRVANLRRARALLGIAEQAEKDALGDPDEIDNAFARAEESISIATGAGDEAVEEVGAGLWRLEERIQRYIHDPSSYAGPITGWRKFDRLLDGFPPGGVTAVCGPTSRFKSLFVQNIGWGLAQQGIPGLWFTTEMPSIQVDERILGLETGLNIRELRFTGELAQYEDDLMGGIATIAQYPIWKCDKSILDIAFLTAATMRLRRSKAIEYVIVDLLDHVQSSRYGREAATKNEEFITQQIKDLAKRCDLHVIYTSHVAKNRDQRGTRRPHLDVEDMKGASSKGQDADVAISIMAVQQKNADLIPSNDWSVGNLEAVNNEEFAQQLEKGEGYALAFVLKNRSGTIGGVPFHVDLNKGGRMYPKS